MLAGVAGVNALEMKRLESGESIPTLISTTPGHVDPDWSDKDSLFVNCTPVTDGPLDEVPGLFSLQPPVESTI